MVCGPMMICGGETILARGRNVCDQDPILLAFFVVVLSGRANRPSTHIETPMRQHQHKTPMHTEHLHNDILTWTFTSGILNINYYMYNIY